MPDNSSFRSTLDMQSRIVGSAPRSRISATRSFFMDLRAEGFESFFWISSATGGCGHDQWRDSHGLSGYRTGEFQLEGALRDGGRRGKGIEGSDNERRD